MRDKRVKIIGAGLAGCEACWQLVRRGVGVDLYEMKPKKFSRLIPAKNLRSWSVPIP